MVVGAFSSRGGPRQLRSKPTMVLYVAMDPQAPLRPAFAGANKTVTSDPAGPQTRVETDVRSTPPSKTQGFLTIRVVFFDSTAEWRCPCAQRISFYKGFRDFVDRCVKSISFYDEFCALERPVFCGVSCTCFARRVLRGFHLNRAVFLQKHQFLQVLVRLPNTPQICIENAR